MSPCTAGCPSELLEIIDGRYWHTEVMPDAFDPRPADIVWNRACAHQGDGVGDRHLGALLRVHGVVMNGGPNHAADSCDPAEIAAAADACRYFGLDTLGSVVQEFPAASSDSDDEDAEDRLSAAYYQLVPDDSTLSGAVEARYTRTPDDFDPITEQPCRSSRH